MSKYRVQGCGRVEKTSDSQSIRPWNNRSDNGGDAGSRASVSERPAFNTDRLYRQAAERLFLVPPAKAVCIPAEISVIVGSFLLRGNGRPYLGKNRGALYRITKNQKPFYFPVKTRENSRAKFLTTDAPRKAAAISFIFASTLKFHLACT